MRIELVYATSEEQVLIDLDVDECTSVQQAIELSAIQDRFPGDDLSACQVGIWGRVVERDYLVRDGDRVELYRPLSMDPRDARRHRIRD